MSDQPSTSAQLRVALVAEFPAYVSRRLSDLGIMVPDELLARCAADLDESLGWLEDAPSDLGESPLELVRIATEPVTAALLEADAKPVDRDPKAVELHPDDVFDLRQLLEQRLFGLQAA